MRWLTAACLGLCSALAATTAFAERCDGPPQAGTSPGSSSKKWKFCVDVIKADSGGWTLDGDRKTVDIEVPKGDKADIIFRMDQDEHPEAWLAAVSIHKKDGSDAPPGEFVADAPASHDFGDSRKINLNGKRISFRVKNRNSYEGDYSYTIWIRTTDRGADFPVDPGIKNRGN